MTVTDKGSIQILEPEGWLDTKTAPLLVEQFESAHKQGAKHLVIDCHAIDYISSAGIRALQKIGELLAPIDGSIVLCDLKDYVEEVFVISGLNTFFSIEKSLETALLSLQDRQHSLMLSSHSYSFEVLALL